MKNYATLIENTPLELLDRVELRNKDGRSCPLGVIAQEEGWNPEVGAESDGYEILEKIFTEDQMQALYLGYDSLHYSGREAKAKQFAIAILRSWGYE